MKQNLIDETLKLKCQPDRFKLGRKTALPVLFLAMTVAGCAVNMDIDVGKRPNLAAIEQRLRIGESTVDDVLAVLGPPRGKGKAMLPIDPKRRITWSYSYLQASVRSSPGSEDKGDMRSLILFVFFDQDRYAGYMWFSSVPE